MRRIASLHLLVAILAVSTTFVTSASAAPVWEHCTKGAVEGQTKWMDHNCAASSGEGEWQWKEVENTEEIRLKGSLLLADAKASILGESAVECYSEDKGFVGPEGFARITEVQVPSCRNIKNCETVDHVEARNLPWQTELVETEEKISDLLTGTAAGKEQGWLIECTELGMTEKDECVQEEKKEEGLSLENKATGSELLVLGTFQQKRKTLCSLGGKETGSVKGSTAISMANTWGLKVNLRLAGVVANKTKLKIPAVNGTGSVTITNIGRDSAELTDELGGEGAGKYEIEKRCNKTLIDGKGGFCTAVIKRTAAGNQPAEYLVKARWPGKESGSLTIGVDLEE